MTQSIIHATQSEGLHALTCYATLIRKETQVPQIEVSHQKLSQASPLCRTYVQYFRAFIDHCNYFQTYSIPLLLQKKRPSFANGRKKLVKVQGCSHKRNARREYKRLKTTEPLIYLFILPRNEGLPQKIQTEHTDTLN